MEIRTDRILITGACGWLGKRLTRVIAQRSLDLDLLRELPRNLRIRCLVLSREDTQEVEKMGVEVLQGNLCNPADCAKFCEGAKNAVLLHAAGIIHPRRVKELYQVNV